MTGLISLLLLLLLLLLSIERESQSLDSLSQSFVLLSSRTTTHTRKNAGRRSTKKNDGRVSCVVSLSLSLSMRVYGFGRKKRERLK